ncbi:MAG: HAD family phosphatase [Bacteroidia bacterium]|nr:HAD family phosphatase [Bacteroidia bacterium]
MPIKNIILDLGVVIIDVDYNKTAEAFKKLGLSNFDEIYSKKKQDHFFDDFEKGILDVADFRDEVRTHIAGKLSDRQIDKAWNAMLGRVPHKRVELLESLSQKYDLYLLSNTNKIHVPAFSKILDEDHDLEKFYSLFKSVYLSCELEMRKPDKEIFDLVINENNLNRDECIFIDDTPHHVEGGKRAGIASFHLADGQDLTEFLPSLLNREARKA